MTSDAVWVAEEEPGWWVALCCDSRCASAGMHAMTETEHKASAYAVAARHRRFLTTLPDQKTGEVKAADVCGQCGQAPSVMRKLRELVAELEDRLAVLEIPDREKPSR